ncbi:hypothetical protein GobsT_23630 [Gemmata obscuriglobus]|uniref:Uncharacterized protein n=1 Tax=Gemmata algarum TaxID=2975278 RepID=A0ABU5FC02_9BACT|nr:MULTISPECIES: hypothetical protein [Gemmata]MDY3554367.1 hypothetical protein [Gemmata algarum]MDY3563351.1 hypothetical protein [Gemmata algarum]QEG27604.1 hypothetical protein GobsT_23630 [Gemmata obscuriglobus]VTS04731.1 Uncharacterized protein OS=Planctomyces brasiliensis (strain ATCC 49424 / DSM 5305 / JCM 21570 / NBRC 103401 / IFAM 1448) GN=Plabr_2513 PE=4 SV=1 [Gemmata obscuriglobus UQM 2246]
MRPFGLFLVTALGAGPAGCGGPPAPAPEEAPLTVEQWKALPAQKKYEVETLERVKHGSPKFQDQQAWDKFIREVMVPARKKDGLDPKK